MIKKIILTIVLASISILAFAQRIQIAHGPYLQSMKENEVTIVWLASENSVGWIELAPNDDTHFYLKERPKYFDATNGVKNVSTLHTVKIKGLKPGTSYRYRVYAHEVLEHKGTEVIYGKMAATSVYKKEPLMFVTNDITKPSVSFAMINDIHKRTEEISILMDVAKVSERDLVFFNGDMLSDINTEEELFVGFMDAAIESFAKEIPMYYARGNHETRGEYATSFQRYFSPQEEHLYYMFTQGPACFIVLDTGEDKPDSDIEYSGITCYDSYRSEQQEWLKEALLSEEFKQAKYKIVIAHIPPVSGNKGWHGQHEIGEKFIPLLNDVGIDVMLCAHTHRYIRTEKTDEIKFPVIVNAHQTVLTGVADNNGLVLEIKTLGEKLVDRIYLPKK